MPRLSFTLRDVFWLTLVVGMGVGWWVHARRAETRYIQEVARASRERRVLLALEDNTYARFPDAPLRSIVSYFSDVHGVAINLDRPELESIGITDDTKISLAVSGVSLREALQQCVGSQVGFVVSDQGILLTTRTSQRPVSFVGTGPIAGESLPSVGQP